jgi:integrase
LETGDAEFEESRRVAQKELDGHAADAGHKGRSEHLTERLIESKTGRKVQYARIADLPARWRGMGRKVRACESHLAHCDGYFRRFVEFMQKQNPKAVYLYEVTPEDATVFVDHELANLGPATAQYRIRMLAKSMSRFLPVGAVNPFAEFVGTRMNVAGSVVHRQPFTRDELQALLAVARSDTFMYPLIVTAACTGMRRGDVCGLRWKAVDLAAGMLTVKTSKTGKKAEIPIFAPLREVLVDRQSGGGEFVFPEAARMLRGSPQGLSWRFKRLVAASMDDGVSVDPAPRVSPGEVEVEGLAAVNAQMVPGSRRDRILDTFRRYCAGESVRGIEKATGSARATVSADLHAVQDLIGKPFLPARQGGSLVAAVARLTRVSRVRGQRAASVRDWHALRTTYVTLALSAGVPVELVRRVTGHATVDIVLENYFRPDREQFKTALNLALPDVLTGDKSAAVPSSIKELQDLTAKVAGGTATEADRVRLRIVAAVV